MGWSSSDTLVKELFIHPLKPFNMICIEYTNILLLACFMEKDFQTIR
ncbi:hypothetical protein J14TS5_56130 [Paenibacillus lautus]|nr:hypothetical protein J14TS5_56130 [Paenibacillus lautus]